MVWRSIKKRIVLNDYKEKNLRKILNFGHTFGHAIEALTKYKITHGQAITLGMDFANYVSYNYNKLSREKYELIKNSSCLFSTPPGDNEFTLTPLLPQ